MVSVETIGGRCLLLGRVAVRSQWMPLLLLRHSWSFSRSRLLLPSSVLPSPFLFSSSPDQQSSKVIGTIGGRCQTLVSSPCTHLVLSRHLWMFSRSPLPMPSSSTSPFLFASSSALQPAPRSLRPLCSSPDVKPADRKKRNKFAASKLGFFKKWEIPWDEKAVLVTTTALGLTFFFTSLPLTALLYSLGVRDISVLFYISQSVQSFGGTFVIMAGIRKYSPLPSDLFNYALRDPFSVSRGWLLWSVVGIFCAVAAYILAAGLILYSNGKPLPRQDLTLQLLPLLWTSNPSTPLLLSAIGILAPFWEETFFRGFLLTSLTKWMPTYAAVIFSAGAFALAHFSLSQIPQLFAMGVISGFAYSKSGNLLTPIAIHAVWNLSVSFVFVSLRKQGYNIEELLS